MTPALAVTHDGIFHADDVVGAAILRRAFPAIRIERTRAPARIAEADIVFDVGGEYDPARHRYDHHQRGRAKRRAPWVLEYSSAGLLWEAFGRLALSAMGVADAHIEEVWTAVDKPFIAAIDAADNGQLYTLEPPLFEGVYAESISHYISALNPCWHEQQGKAAFDAAFEEAVDLADRILVRKVRSVQGTILARSTVAAAVAAAEGGPVVVLERFAPWQDSLLDDPAAAAALYVVYPGETGETWMVQCVPPSRGSFGQRRPLPEPWAGLRDAALADASGVTDAVFCHPGRFIGGARSREGALALARAAVG